jgi:hypothetical protein
VLWSAVQTTCFKVKAKLACDVDFVAERRERFSDQLFVGERAVHFGGIEEHDAFCVRCADDLDALVPVCGRAVVGANTHAPSSYFRDF